MRNSQGEPSLNERLNSEKIRRRFEALLDKSAASFMSSILAIYKSNKKLQECSPDSILAAAGIAAALKLPINPSLGFAFIVPYKGHATFQIGWKGFVQLAMRSGQYRTLNSGSVREGQIEEIDFVTGEIIRGEKISDEIVGYVAYMELINGFKKSLYMSVDEMQAHAEKYSQSYAYDLRSGRKSSVWSTNFDAMAKKTVLKKLLNNFGIISIDQQSAALATALQADQAVITEDGFRYIDNERGSEKIVPFTDVIGLPEGDDDPDDTPDDNDTPHDNDNDNSNDKPDEQN
ncbi:MAG: recombinase RecT [Selenomonadaceae bacterium]|nr:recombinase RecT [Selenomonadaceae bacterium]